MVFRTGETPILLLGDALDTAEERVDRRQQEQIENGRGGEAAEDDDGHGVFDFVAGEVAADDEGDEGETGSEGGHEDRSETLFCAADDERDAEGLAFDFLQVAVVAYEHDAVAGR